MENTETISDIIGNAYQLPENFSSLECGANAVHDIQTIKWSKNKNFWLMEPIPVFANDIRKNITSNIIQSALSTFDGKTKFTIFPSSGWSCISDTELNVDQKTEIASKMEIEVQCLTYKTLQDNLKLFFDILVLDIEGHEEKILEYFKAIDVNYLPKILCIECGYDWENRKELVKQNGYNLDFYYYNNAYFSHSSSEIILNKEVVDEYNKNNPKFIFNNYTVYTNELI